MPSPSCPSLEEITAFNAGRLTSEARLAAIADHLETCRDCLETLQSLPEDTHWARVAAMDDTTSVFGVEPQLQQALTRIEAIPRNIDRVPAISQIGDYQILESLGRGGMGSVYKAWHPRLHRAVVLKTIREHSADDPVAVEQFRTEMSAIGRLDHPAIVKAYDAEEYDGREYLVMEYVAGENLRAMLRRESRLPVSDACAVAHEVALGLQHLHERGFVHRDIKPSNIVLSAERVVKILDLGLAFHSQESSHSNVYSGEGLLGTLDYMAPEQISNSLQVDSAADLYSLGATLFTLLTGEPPFFKFDTRAEKIRAVRETVPPKLTDVRSDVPKSLAALVHRLLEKNPRQRPKSAREVATLLRPLARKSMLVRIAEPADVGHTTDRRWWFALFMVAVLLTLGGTILLSPAWTEWLRPPDGDSAASTVSPSIPPPEKVVDVTANAKADGAKSDRPRYQAWSVGGSGNMLAGLAVVPAKFPDISRWQVETVRPRGFVRALAVHFDGQHLACVGDDDNIRVFRRTGDRMELLRILPTRPSNLPCARCLTWSPDGKFLAMGMALGDRPVEVWEWEAGLLRFELRGHASGVADMAWNSAGTFLATAGVDGRLRIWNRDGLIEQTFDSPNSVGSSVAWNPSLNQVVVSFRDGNVRVYDAQAGAELTSLEKQQSAVVDLAWQPTGKHLAVVTEDHQLRIFDPAVSTAAQQTMRIPSPFRELVWAGDGSVLHVIASLHLKWDGVGTELVAGSHGEFPDPWVVGSWSRGSNSLIMASVYGQIREVPHGSDQVKDLLQTPRTFLRDLAWNRESTRLAVCSIDGQIQIWGGQGRPMGVVTPSKKSSSPGIRCAAWSLGGKYLAAADHPPANTIHIWEAESFQEMAAFDHGCPVAAIAWSDDVRWLVSVGENGQVRTWEALEKRPGQIFSRHQGYVATVSVAPHTRRFASGDLSGVIHVWEIDDQGAIQPIAELPKQPESVLSVAWSTHGDRLAVAGTSHVWMLRGDTGETLWTQATPWPPGRVYWKNDDKRVYCNGLGILDSETGAVLTSAVYPEPASYSPDGRWVAEVLAPAAVSIHHASNQIHHWRGVPLDSDSSVTFSPAGQILYSSETFEDQLAYIVETANNQFETLTPSQFERRINRRISK